MREAPCLEIFVARRRLVVGLVSGMGLVSLGLAFAMEEAEPGVMLLTGLALAAMGMALGGHCLRLLLRHRPHVVVDAESVWCEAWSFGRLPLVAVRRVWISERAEEGLLLNLEVDEEDAPVGRMAASGLRVVGAVSVVSIALAALYLPMGRDELRQDIAFRALQARARRRAGPVPLRARREVLFAELA